jgi:hypothetical protein
MTSRRNLIADAVGLAALATAQSTAAAAPAGQSIVASVPSIDIRTFGAVGDGETDDTDAIRAALAEAGFAGGTVLIPRGVYLIDPARGRLIVASNVTVLGEGVQSVLKVKDDVGNYFTIFAAATSETYVEHVQFRDFRIDQNPSGNMTADIGPERQVSQNVISLYSFFDVSVDRVRFEPYCGVNAVTLNGVENHAARISQCYFRFERGASTRDPNLGLPPHVDYDNSAIYIQCKNHMVEGCLFEAAPEAGAFGAIETHNGQSTIVNNVSDGFMTGVNITSGSHEEDARDTNDITVAGNTFSRTNDGISLWSVTGRRLRGVTIVGNTISVAQVSHDDIESAGIRLVYSAGADVRGPLADVTIVGNTIVFEQEPLEGRTIDAEGREISPFTSYGIGLAPFGDIQNVLVVNNVVTLAPATGILLGNADTENVSRNVRIADNLIVNAGQNAGMPGRSRAAIALQSILTDVVVEHNSIIDTGDPVRGVQSIRAMPAVAERTVVRDNHIGTRVGELLYRIDRDQVRDLVNAVVSGTAPPSSGTWARGDIMYHLEPTPGGNVGWVCVEGGAPGQWSTFGAIEAAAEGGESNG